MTKTILSSLILLSTICSVFGQNAINNHSLLTKDTTIARYKYYHSIEEASKVPVDSVYNIWFISTGFKKFPSEVLKFSQLRSLAFGCDDKLKRINDLSEKERTEVIEAKNKLGVTYLPDYYNPNTFKKVPKKIKGLKNLVSLELFCTNVSKRHGKRIKKWLPRCEVLYDTMDDDLK